MKEVMNYSGMTLNERLYKIGLIEEFEKALARKDREKVISILNKVKVDKSSIRFILKELGFSSGLEEEE